MVQQCDLFVQTDDKVWAYFNQLEGHEYDATRDRITTVVKDHVDRVNGYLTGQFRAQRPVRFNLKTLQINDDLSCREGVRNPTCSARNMAAYHDYFAAEDWSSYCAAIAVTNLNDRLKVQAQVFAADTSNDWGLCSPHSASAAKSHNTAVVNLFNHRGGGIRPTDQTVVTLTRVLAAFLGYTDEDRCANLDEEFDSMLYEILYSARAKTWSIDQCGSTKMAELLSQMHQGQRPNCLLAKPIGTCRTPLDYRQWFSENYWLTLPVVTFLIITGFACAVGFRILKYFSLVVRLEKIELELPKLR